jgi:protein involved in polysaccharide export with SLBB domain
MLLTGCCCAPGSQNALLHSTQELLQKTPPNLPSELNKQVLRPYIVEPGDVLLVHPADTGEQRVLTDGTINLGRFGVMVVANKTLPEIEVQVRAAVAKEGKEAEGVSVRLVASHSKFYYVLGEVNAPGAYPLTGRETVLDGIAMACGPTCRAARCRMILSRPTAPDCCRIVVPICYDEIVQQGDTTTNYQLMPGDRIFVPSQSLCEACCGWFRKDDKICGCHASGACPLSANCAGDSACAVTPARGAYNFGALSTPLKRYFNWVQADDATNESAPAPTADAQPVQQPSRPTPTAEAQPVQQPSRPTPTAEAQPVQQPSRPTPTAEAQPVQQPSRPTAPVNVLEMSKDASPVQTLPMEAPKPITFEKPQPAAPETPKPIGMEMLKPITPDGPTPMAVEMPKPTTMESPKPMKIECVKPATVETPKPMKIECLQPAIVETPKPMKIECTESKTVESPKPIKIECVKPATVESPKPIKIESVKPATVEAPKPIKSECVKPATVEAPKPIKSECVKPATVEAQKPGAAPPTVADLFRQIIFARRTAATAGEETSAAESMTTTKPATEKPTKRPAKPEESETSKAAPAKPAEESRETSASETMREEKETTPVSAEEIPAPAVSTLPKTVEECGPPEHPADKGEAKPSAPAEPAALPALQDEAEPIEPQGSAAGPPLPESRSLDAFLSLFFGTEAPTKPISRAEKPED